MGNMFNKATTIVAGIAIGVTAGYFLFTSKDKRKQKLEDIKGRIRELKEKIRNGNDDLFNESDIFK